MVARSDHYWYSHNYVNNETKTLNMPGFLLQIVIVTELFKTLCMYMLICLKHAHAYHGVRVCKKEKKMTGTTKERNQLKLP